MQSMRHVRDERIVSAYDSGLKRKELCDLFGLSPQRLGQILIKAGRGTQPLLEQLEQLIQDSAEDECILWPYAKTRDGYGRLRCSGAITGAHVLALTRTAGARPEGLEAAHSCGVPECINPQHLRWATPKENQADRRDHGTDPVGEQNGRAKLTAADVLKIRARASSGESHQSISEDFPVGRSGVSLIVNRRRWTHLPGVDR